MVSTDTRLRQIIGHQYGAEVAAYNLEQLIKSQENPSFKSFNPLPKSKFFNPLTSFMGWDWLYKLGSTLTDEDKRAMAKNPIIGSIIHTRLNQVASFCSPNNSSYDYGFRIVRDSSSPPPYNLDTLTSFIFTAGLRGYGDSSLSSFVRKFMRDSLILDQACGEVVPSIGGPPSYFMAVDASTIRRLKASLEPLSYGSEEPMYVQVINSIIVARYTHDQMIFGMRNPRSDLYANGYGISELDLLIHEVTTLMNAAKVNSQTLSQGGTSKGVLVLTGDIGDLEYESFRQDFKKAVLNAATNWSPPVVRVGSEGKVDWVALDRSNKDMEYAQLFEYLVKLATGVYQISPEEVNWVIGSSGTNVSFNSGAKDKLKFSVDKGLRPLLSFLSSCLTESLLRLFDPLAKVEFTGLGSSRSEEVDLRVKEVSSYKTINEVRSDSGLPSIEGGNIILNSVFVEPPLPSSSSPPPPPLSPLSDDLDSLPQFVSMEW